jgi:hypothetical protein
MNIADMTEPPIARLDVRPLTAARFADLATIFEEGGTLVLVHLADCNVSVATIDLVRW